MLRHQIFILMSSYVTEIVIDAWTSPYLHVPLSCSNCNYCLHFGQYVVTFWADFFTICLHFRGLTLLHFCTDFLELLHFGQVLFTFLGPCCLHFRGRCYISGRKQAFRKQSASAKKRQTKLQDDWCQKKRGKDEETQAHIFRKRRRKTTGTLVDIDWARRSRKTWWINSRMTIISTVIGIITNRDFTLERFLFNFNRGVPTARSKICIFFSLEFTTMVTYFIIALATHAPG